MKCKAAISDEAPRELFATFGGAPFAREVLDSVIGDALGVENPTGSPGEYYVQHPDKTVTVEDDVWGIEVRLTGVSRGSRKAAQFHRAIDALEAICIEHAVAALADTRDGGRAQVFCVIMLDGDIETAPGSGVYTNVIESKAVWVTHEGPEQTDDEDSAPAGD